MRISKKDFKLLISCMMLFLFLIKIASPVSRLLKTQKQVSLIGNCIEEQDSSDKKEEAKPNLNFNEFTDFLTEKLPVNLHYQTVLNSYSDYKIGFLATHFPAVITPPPNC